MPNDFPSEVVSTEYSIDRHFGIVDEPPIQMDKEQSRIRHPYPDPTCRTFDHFAKYDGRYSIVIRDDSFMI
jgi:hypothetical protein